MKPDLSLKWLLLAKELSAPASLRPYAYLIAQVSYSIANSRVAMPVSVERLAWLIAGVGQLESGLLTDRPLAQRVGLMGLDFTLHAARLPGLQGRDLGQSSGDPLWSVELGAGSSCRCWRPFQATRRWRSLPFATVRLPLST